MSAATPAESLLEARDWERLRRWYGSYGRHNLPWRQNRSPWRVLLAETLLHRTRAASVATVYPAVVREFPSPQAIPERAELWRELTRSLGLAWRAEKFILTCQELVRKHNGQVPERIGDLERLPGIGHYVASAVACFGFNRPAVLVDTNTIRLASRISGKELAPSRHRTRAVRETVARLGEGGAPEPDDNFALLDLAALVCTPRLPQCTVCPLMEGCVTGRSAIRKVENLSGGG